ncbi:MAG: dTDP-4-dehydrorhamnose reductase [Candidatus Doudnabacteria bacterium RIFCSPHIGHO2_02_FULL_48_21]|uniref:dTDP-4-dehydrorhamnose reductase n=1 Tax=Candidatus Doudnabacteria bacterium RIFCSPLOWO2_02_FULL_48_13 TaxID=1817845 RepID=A0A1F5Q9F0_9BACT|nr:MAG: dTDP-4-dehydrorhamnose reductase [Candidatus Doudnabacteria bacterium RIFCSPHIGHO2_01_48_18]OGE79880.1 MAG: dTDP-4-dehydrorhamnose reductase [Candidatus Doudnabacteria bacterium RIFCSPHIGHO2_01_FULL_48_180]OGE91057.1 MAG: dTDP-4-dehydrorhamnose reductase [Candidatus Doudnabacteria bacterium RIFCSPHIGHO2_12_FULL_47_25]OGE94043.1 MAG: dTDP-4-dehydrorhamnose reductase [Candidatus Doudnabacteria bacterium RIFCSPHIGHO2_02_FULL_48_21]OGE98055.1 MAG: dTDP-4-dehydrorhamnose reductase [Candidatu
MKILIIGSNGLLGRALAAEFQREHQVISWDRENIDITDGRAVNSKIPEAEPDVIINSAAYTDVDGAEADSKLANLINGTAVGYLTAVAKKLNIPIVHFSTEYVFDGENHDGYAEDTHPSPISAYGRSKLLGERALMQNSDQYYLIRLSRLFGEQSAASGKKSFVKQMTDLAASKHELEIVDEELSSPTYAPDLARTTVQIVESKMPYGVYHAANSGACTWYGMAQEIFKIREIDVKLNPVAASRFPRPAQRPKFAVLLNTKLPAQRPWQEALKEFLS